MNTDNSNRYRVSTKFTIVKIFVYFGLSIVLFNLVRSISNSTITLKSITGLAIGTLFLVGLLYYIRRRKILEYDDIKHVLYIFNPNGVIEMEVPVEKIEKILYSAIGFGRGYNSYVIIYRDLHHQKQKVRLFPIPYTNAIDTIITDTKLKNPDVLIRNWSMGWNELLD